MLCRHCQQANVARPRGLCWVCYYTPGVRELHPSTSKFGRRGLGLGAARTLPPWSTGALPGTPEKIAVLAQRAALRQELWHPDDATLLTRLAQSSRPRQSEAAPQARWACLQV